MTRDIAPAGTTRPRRFLKVGVILGLSVTLAVAGGAAAVFVHVQNKFKQTHRNIPVDAKPDDGKPVNVLVLGSDRRDVVDTSVREKRQYRGGDSGQRADTIILIHISGDRKRAVLLHFPRDLRVRIPGRTGFHKINSAYEGGPSLMVKTVRKYTGLRIHHYVEVNFQSFRSIVNELGGVELCVNRSYDDPQSGLHIAQPGCYEFDGDEALSYVRARKVDPDGDFGRIRRQQQFMRTLMDKITSLGVLLNPAKVIGLANAVSKGVVTDKGLSLGFVRTIANRLAGFNQKSVDFRVVPSYSKFIDGLWFVVDRPQEAKPLFAAIRKDAPVLPPYGKTSLSLPDPSDVELTIRNASGDSLFGRSERARLRELGFVVERLGTTGEQAATVILHEPGAELKAQLVSDQYPDADVRVSTAELPSEVVLVLGADAAAAARTSATASPGG